MTDKDFSYSWFDERGLFMKNSFIAFIICFLVALMVWMSSMSNFFKGVCMCIIAVAEWLIRESFNDEDETVYWLQSIVLIFSGVIGSLYLFAGLLDKVIAI